MASTVNVYPLDTYKIGKRDKPSKKVRLEKEMFVCMPFEKRKVRLYALTSYPTISPDSISKITIHDSCHALRRYSLPPSLSFLTLPSLLLEVNSLDAPNSHLSPSSIFLLKPLKCILQLIAKKSRAAKGCWQKMTSAVHRL